MHGEIEGNKFTLNQIFDSNVLNKAINGEINERGALIGQWKFIVDPSDSDNKGRFIVRVKITNIHLTPIERRRLGKLYD